MGEGAGLDGSSRKDTVRLVGGRLGDASSDDNEVSDVLLSVKIIEAGDSLSEDDPEELLYVFSAGFKGRDFLTAAGRTPVSEQ